MEKLIELLKQIQELAGVGVDALEGASKGDKPEGGQPPHGGGAPGGPPPEGHEPDGDEGSRPPGR
jgi:hypothetical protein